MAEQIISVMIIVAVVIIAITLVFAVGRPVIEKAAISSKISEAEFALKTIENSINEVVSEGIGSSRAFIVKFPGDARIMGSEDAAQFSIESPVPVFDYLSRSFVTENIARISESGVLCSYGGNIIMENQFVRVELQYVPEAQPLSEINTKNNIKSITLKDEGETIYPVDSSVYIDIYPETSAGTGYSELLAGGKQPVCTAHFFIDSAIDYDIYYKLYSGADFVVVEVANIR